MNGSTFPGVRSSSSRLAIRFAAGLPRGYAALADQLRRASMSIPLNIAEGAGKVSARDKAGYFAIARGSATECAALLDVIAILTVIPPADLAAAKELLHRAVSMLTKLCHPTRS